jgi:signal peptidase I
MIGNYIFLALVLISFFGLSKLFAKAGQESWKAFVPFYNFYILSKLLDKPWWWCLIMVVPGVNLMMYGVYGFNVARAFNKPSDKDLLYASLMPYLFFVTAGFDETAKYVGLAKYKKEPSSFVKNWVDPIIFAVIAASIIRTFFLEAFTIPTSSLEKSLMVGDFLFVNKLAFGPKIPQTPIAFPFAHHTLPFSTTKKSYLEWIKLPYFRLPGFGKPKNGDIVVFNYPDGDTVALGDQNSSYYFTLRYTAYVMKMQDMNDKKPLKSDNYYRAQAWEYMHNPQNINFTNNMPVGDIIARPADKREHYVKRCVAIAGDKLEIKDGEIFINDVKQTMPEHAQHKYYVKTSGALFGQRMENKMGQVVLSNQNLLDKLDIYVTPNEAELVSTNVDTCLYLLTMPPSTVAEVKKMEGVLSVERKIDKKGVVDIMDEISIFPHNPNYKWNNDNFGPLQIPAAGQTLKIDTTNVCLYEKILSTYDNGIHRVEKKGAQVLYDGNPITEYTFKQGYYWLMGDNRHNSADSRCWGFVPYDHVVGKPMFVWFSMKYADNNPVSGKDVVGSLFKNSKEGKFRWERFLCYVGEDGLVSVKIPFIAIVLGLWGWSKWNSRRKLKATAKK